MDAIAKAPAGRAKTKGSLLFEPINVGPIRLRNRIAATPMGLSQYVDADNSPTERMVAQMRRRAAGGPGLVAVETTFVEDYRPSKIGLAGFYSDHQIPRWAVVADAIKMAGAKATIEIFERWHEDFPYNVADLSVAQIEKLIDCYVRGAERCRAAGFDAITFQMAGNWPLSRFASPLSNHRHDKYGAYGYVGSEVIRRCRAAVGNSMALIPRFTILEDRHGKIGVTLKLTTEELVPAFEDAGADALDLNLGLGPIAKTANDHWCQEHVYDPPGSKFELFGPIMEAASRPVISRSGINNVETARRAIDEGWMDIVGIGRQMVADPDFPLKMREGREEDIVHCIHCMYCGDQIAHSRTRTLMRCVVNGSFGRELDAPPSAPAIRGSQRRVTVVGGGATGMQAALALSERGASVTLYERENELGGLNRLVARMPHLLMAALAHATQDLERLLRASNVTIRLDSNITEDSAFDEKPNALVLATGSRPPLSAPLVGKPIVRSYVDYLAGKPFGKKVVVDGNGEGAEFAVSLARGGAEVTLVEPAIKMQSLPYDYLGRRIDALRDFVPESGVRVMMASRIVAIDGQTVTVQHRGGMTTDILADDVLVAGRQPLLLDEERLRRVTPAIHLVGDCASPLGLGEAMDGARALAAALA